MALLTMEVPERHARTRAVTRDTLLPANRAIARGRDASRDVARVVSDVSVLCPLVVVGSDTPLRGGSRLAHARRKCDRVAPRAMTAGQDRRLMDAGLAFTHFRHSPQIWNDFPELVAYAFLRITADSQSPPRDSASRTSTSSVGRF
jgi:hypothetical protein